MFVETEIVRAISSVGAACKPRCLNHAAPTELDSRRSAHTTNMSPLRGCGALLAMSAQLAAFA